MKTSSSLGLGMLIFILSSCSSISSHSMIGPDGTENELIDCSNTSADACYAKAREVCGGNYKIVTNNAYAPSKYTSQELEIMVKCDSGHAVHVADLPSTPAQKQTESANDFANAKSYQDCEQYQELARDDCRTAVYNRAHPTSK